MCLSRRQLTISISFIRAHGACALALPVTAKRYVCELANS